MKTHNFSAGPSILSQYTIEETIKGIQNFSGTGLSVLEVSHRSKEFEAVVNETSQLFKDLLNIPDNYHVVFMGGGASLQFCMVPYNLLQTKAAYLNTGMWSSKAIKEAKLFGDVSEIASSKDQNFNYIPKDYTIPNDADYFHITTNNTIFGTEIKKDLDSPIPLVADTSSDIFSRPMDISKYAIVYGGAQKNLGPAGLAFAIIREDVLGKVERAIPSMLDYQVHIENGSMYNTPPCVNIFASLQTLKWYKSQGGVVAMHKKNIEKAALLYNEIDRNKLFEGTAREEDRSIMNITFVMKKEYTELEGAFNTLALSRGISGIKGHRSVGGFRASVYNAMPIDSIQELVNVMQEFEKNN